MDELEQVQCRATAMTEVSARGREVERDGVFSLEKKRFGRILTMCVNMGEREREGGDRQTFPSTGPRGPGAMNTLKNKIQSEHQKRTFFSFEAGQTLELSVEVTSLQILRTQLNTTLRNLL